MLKETPTIFEVLQKNTTRTNESVIVKENIPNSQLTEGNNIQNIANTEFNFREWPEQNFQYISKNPIILKNDRNLRNLLKKIKPYFSKTNIESRFVNRNNSFEEIERIITKMKFYANTDPVLFEKFQVYIIFIFLFWDGNKKSAPISQ